MEFNLPAVVGACLVALALRTPRGFLRAPTVSKRLSTVASDRWITARPRRMEDVACQLTNAFMSEYLNLILYDVWIVLAQRG